MGKSEFTDRRQREVRKVGQIPAMPDAVRTFQNGATVQLQTKQAKTASLFCFYAYGSPKAKVFCSCLEDHMDPCD